MPANMIPNKPMRRMNYKPLLLMSLLLAAASLIGAAAKQDKAAAPAAAAQTTPATPETAPAAPATAPPAPDKPDFVGSETCQACHEDIFNAFVKIMANINCCLVQYG